jgi:hypothetical protein
VNDQRRYTVDPLTSGIVIGGVTAAHLDVRPGVTPGKVHVGIRRGVVTVALLGSLEDLVEFAVTLTNQLGEIQAAEAVNGSKVAFASRVRIPIIPAPALDEDEPF